MLGLTYEYKIYRSASNWHSFILRSWNIASSKRNPIDKHIKYHPHVNWTVDHLFSSFAQLDNKHLFILTTRSDKRELEQVTKTRLLEYKEHNTLSQLVNTLP